MPSKKHVKNLGKPKPRATLKLGAIAISGRPDAVGSFAKMMGLRKTCSKCGGLKRSR